MHLITPLKMMMAEGEECLLDAVESDDPSFIYMQELHEGMSGLHAKCPDPDALNETALFLARHALSVWVSAVRLAYTGHAYAIPSVLRTALEAVCYALIIARDPSLAVAWHGRIESEEGMKASKKAFQGAIAKARDILEQEEPTTGAYMYKLYLRMIDEGAHPNRKAIWTRPVMVMGGGQETQYLTQTTDWHHPESLVGRKFILDCATVGLNLYRVTALTFSVPLADYRSHFKPLNERLLEMITAFNESQGHRSDH